MIRLYFRLHIRNPFTGRTHTIQNYKDVIVAEDEMARKIDKIKRDLTDAIHNYQMASKYDELHAAAAERQEWERGYEGIR